MTIFTIDVSHHDWNRRGGNLDWARIRRDGIGVMCARATYGDPSGFHPLTQHFGEFQAGAEAVGFVLRGGYHNLVRGDAASMRRQVAWFRSELDRYGCDWAMLDVERYEELVSNDLWPRFEDVLRFRDAWAAADDRPLAYYLPQWLWSGHLGKPDLRQLGGLLVSSNYGPNGDGLPAALYASRGGDTGPGWAAYGGVVPALWQFGSDCDLPGASSATDINAFRGSVEQLRAILTGDSTVADYGRFPVPALVDGRTPDLMTAEAWTILHMGCGLYGTKSPRGGVLARLDRIEDALIRLEARPTADVDEAALAELLAPHLPEGADPAAIATAVAAKLGAALSAAAPPATGS